MKLQALLSLVTGAVAVTVGSASSPGLNGFVTTGDDAMPAAFSLERASPFYWTNLTGVLYMLQAVSDIQTMILYIAPCLAYETDSSTCTAYEQSNPGAGLFGGPGWVGVGGQAAAPSAVWQIDLYWSPENLTGTSWPTSTVRSPTFALVSAITTSTTATATATAMCNATAFTSTTTRATVSSGGAAGIAVGCFAGGLIAASTVFTYIRRHKQRLAESQGQYLGAASSTSKYTRPPAELATESYYEMGNPAR